MAVESGSDVSCPKTADRPPAEAKLRGDYLQNLGDSNPNSSAPPSKKELEPITIVIPDLPESAIKAYKLTASKTEYLALRADSAPENGFRLVVDKKNGDMQIAEGKDQPIKDGRRNTETRALRDSVLKQMDERLTEPDDKVRFRANIARFEARTKSENVSDQNINETYKHLLRLLDPKTTAKIVPELRTRLTQDLVRQAGLPQSIDQGQHNVCNMTTVEGRMISAEPASVMRAVVDTALTGEYVSSSGKVVKVDDSALKPDKEASRVKREDGDRSFATQIFNHVAVNLAKQYRQPELKYMQVEPVNGGDTGERLYNTQTNSFVVDKSGSPVGAPDVTLADMKTVYNDITGKQEKGFIFTNVNGGILNEGTVGISSPKELESALTAAKAQGKFPIIVSINTRVHNFQKGSSEPVDMTGDAVHHVMLVRDFTPSRIENGKLIPGSVKLDNQWGSQNDVGIWPDDTNSFPIGTLARAMQSEDDAVNLLTSPDKGYPDEFTSPELRELEVMRLSNTTPEKLADFYVSHKDLIGAPVPANSHGVAESVKSKTDDAKARTEYYNRVGSLERNQQLKFFGILQEKGAISQELLVERCRTALMIELMDDHINPDVSARKVALDDTTEALLQLVAEMPQASREKVFNEARDNLTKYTGIPDERKTKLSEYSKGFEWLVNETAKYKASEKRKRK